MACRNPVDPRRVRILKPGPEKPRSPVIYWMSRDQRAQDNWALLYAQQTATRLEAPLIVAFCVADSFLGATRRHYGFMLRGLAETIRALSRSGIPFCLLHGDPPSTLARLAASLKAGCIIGDFDPLRIKRRWKTALCRHASIPVMEVDAHNIVPTWVASQKQEYGAYTLRPKLSRLLPEFLTEFPSLRPHPFVLADPPGSPQPLELLNTLPLDRSVDEVPAVVPGATAAVHQLGAFIESQLEHYPLANNDPNADCRSHLSPYLHFGQISAQRVALTIQRRPDSDASRAFLEQLIIRRELADNFCLWNDRYDTLAGLPPWARRTLDEHRSDQREYRYSHSQMEHARTHDPLWNAAQMEMLVSGQMHGYMRMYWAKKILEWSPDPADAYTTAIRLNDRYELDGRDPNGYTGVAWAVGGVHDRPWGERQIFGKIRYMNAAGCRRKFDTAAYIDRWLSTHP